MRANGDAALRGFDMPVSDIGAQLHFRLPLLSIGSSPTLYVAGRVDWQADGDLTIVDDPEDLEMATLLTNGMSRYVASGQGVVVAGAEFFHAASRVGDRLNGFSRLSSDCECWIRMATPAEFATLKSELIDESRAVFDQELGKASRQRSPLTERGNAAMLILRRCGPLRREDLAIRQLAAARQNRDFDLYRRLLARFEHELGDSENRLHKQAGRHIELADAPEGVWRWSDIPESKAVLVNEMLAELWLRIIAKEVVEVSIVDDQLLSIWPPAASSGLRDFGKGKPTSGILSTGTKDGWEEMWDQLQSA